MSVARIPFNQGDVTRALKGVRAAGVTAVRTEISPERIVIFHMTDAKPETAETALAEFMARKAARDARST